jgi:hypothetical protein
MYSMPPRPSKNDPIRFHALGPQRIFSTIATLVNAPSRVIALLFLPSSKTRSQHVRWNGFPESTDIRARRYVA